MTPLGNIDALERLRSLLNGDVVVEEDVFPRLVQALVRLSGKKGEEIFGEYLRSAKTSHMSGLLSSISVMVLGAAAVPLLVQCVLATVDLTRIRATTDVLAKLGTMEAHAALLELSRKIKHPVGKELAASKLEELERDHPTRFVLLPRLLNLAQEDPKKLFSDFLSADDRSLVRTLLEVLHTLSPDARTFAHRVLAEKGDSSAARLLQQRLPQAADPAYASDLALALNGIIERNPGAAQGFVTEWADFYRLHANNELPASTAAKILSLSPLFELAPLYGELLSSKFPEVRIAGLAALASICDKTHLPKIQEISETGSPREIAEATAALSAMGITAPLEALCKDRSSQRRALAATICLKAGRPDLWSALALDDERTVRHAAIEALEKAEPEKRPPPGELAPVISFTTDYDSFEVLARVLGGMGDRESAGRLAERLLERDEHISSAVFRALKALRQRGAFKWSDVAGSNGPVLPELLNMIASSGALGLIGACIEDFETEELEKIRNALLLQPASVKQGSAQAVTMAVIGRIHVLTTRKKVIDEIEKVMTDRLTGAREQIEGVNRVTSLWLRADLELTPEFGERIENWMVHLAQDKTIARIARKSAIDAVGKVGSSKVMPLLARLRMSPTEEIAGAAEAALEVMARRFPAANMGGGEEASEKRQSVLIVEDDANIRNLYQTFLFKKGYNAYSAEDGEEALGMMQTAHVDTVLLDLHMAGMDGFRFLEALGRMRKPPPVIVTTSFGDRNTVLRVLKLGAIDFLRKPVDLTEMLARIRKVLA